MLYEVLSIAALTVGFVLASATVWSRKDTWVRGASVAAWLALVPLLVGSTFFSLGHPAPWIQSVTEPGGKYKVIGVKLREPEAIYVWLDFGDEYPRSYALPWDIKKAENLQGLMNDQQRGKIRGFTMTIPMEHSLDTNAKQFHPLPQPKALKPKQEYQPMSRNYNRDGTP